MQITSRLLAVVVGLGLIGGGIAGAAAQGTKALPCNQDYVAVADGSGTIVRLGSGQIFDVFPGQNRKVIVWEPLDKVTVCAIGGAAARITNLDPRKGGSVEAVRQF